MEQISSCVKATAIIQFDYIGLRRQCFLIENKGEVYAITTRNSLFNFYGRFAYEQANIVLCDLQNEDLPNRFIDLNLNRIRSEGNYKEDSNSNLIAFKLSQADRQGNLDWVEGVSCNDGVSDVHEIAVRSDDFESFEDVKIAKPVLLFCYPNYHFKGEKSGHIGTPLLRKGIVATKDQWKSTIILDALSHTSSLGSPVIIHRFRDEVNPYKVIGMLSDNLPFGEWFGNGDEPLLVENSGFSYCIAADFIIQLLESDDSIDSE
jgi:hypothetical protein